MTPPRKMIVYSQRSDPGPALSAVIEDLLAEGQPVPGVLGPSHVARAFAETWAQLTGGTYEEEMQQRVYAVREVTSPRSTPERISTVSGSFRWVVYFDWPGRRLSR